MDGLKRQAAARALEHVQDGMKLGLGTGSTAKHFVELLGEKVAAGMRVIGVPTSEATRIQAEQCKIPLTTLDEIDRLDLTVDGADEVDHALDLIKGGGGALLREKIVATASDQMVVIADDSKLVKTLGAFPLPVEVVRFGFAATRRMVEAMAAQAGCEGPIAQRLVKGGEPFLTDQGNFILDCSFGRISEPEVLAYALKRVPGVVEHGLFLGVADMAIVATAGGVQLLQRTPSRE
jgi:ribose 5-phosphate isomerase A